MNLVRSLGLLTDNFRSLYLRHSVASGVRRQTAFCGRFTLPCLPLALLFLCMSVRLSLTTFLETLMCRSRVATIIFARRTLTSKTGGQSKTCVSLSLSLSDRLRPVPRRRRLGEERRADATYRIVSRRIARPLASSHPAKCRAVRRRDGAAVAHHPSSSRPLVTSCVQHRHPWTSVRPWRGVL